MSLYTWEPTADGYYPHGFSPEWTVGLHYDLLQVEQTGEGWHAILLAFEEDEDGGGFYMVDEQVLPTRDEATLWCESKDASKFVPGEGDEDDWEMFLAMDEEEE